MHIEHIAIWVKDLEKMKAFYVKFFQMESNDKYINQKKKFSSYFLSFKNGARIELMHRPDISELLHKNHFGFAHMAISVGNKDKVDKLTKSIENNGYKIIGYPRTTGDGYYESVILDPEENQIEITV